jgi:HK97 gp10 family phage protein
MELTSGKVLGNKELIKAMRKIPYAVKRDKFFMAVFRQAAKPIIAAARGKINNDEGQLRKSIKAFSTRASRRLPALYVGPKASGSISANSKNFDKSKEERAGGYYGAMVEYGTENAAPHPFMRPAWDQTQNQAKDILLKGAQAIVEKVLQRELKGQKRLYKL